MTVNLRSVTLRFVQDVYLVLIADKHLGADEPCQEQQSSKILTIIALTCVFPPSANVPAVCAQAGEVVASVKASNSEGIIVKVVTSARNVGRREKEREENAKR